MYGILRVFSIILVCLFGLGACQTIYPDCQRLVGDEVALATCQLEVRDYRRGIDKYNWELCEMALRNSDSWAWHIGHGAHKGSKSQIAAFIKQDLTVNGCRMGLRDHWAQY